MPEEYRNIYQSTPEERPAKLHLLEANAKYGDAMAIREIARDVSVIKELLGYLFCETGFLKDRFNGDEKTRKVQSASAHLENLCVHQEGELSTDQAYTHSQLHLCKEFRRPSKFLRLQIISDKAVRKPCCRDLRLTEKRQILQHNPKRDGRRGFSRKNMCQLGLYPVRRKSNARR